MESIKCEKLKKTKEADEGEFIDFYATTQFVFEVSGLSLHDSLKFTSSRAHKNLWVMAVVVREACWRTKTVNSSQPF